MLLACPVEHAGRQGQQAFCRGGIKNLAAIAGGSDQQVLDALLGGGQGQPVHPEFAGLPGKVFQPGMLAVLGMVEVEFERRNGEFLQGLFGLGNQLRAQAFVGAQEAGVALFRFLPANVVPVAVVQDAVGFELSTGQHHAGEQEQFFLIAVEMLLSSFLGQVEVFNDIDVEVLQYRAPGFLGSRFEFGLEAGLQPIEFGIDLVGAFAAPVNLVNVAFDVDAGFNAAQDFVGSAEDALEQAEFFAEKFKDAFVGPVALIDEIDHDDIVFLPMTMDAADALLDPLRIPGQVVIDRQRAELEVDRPC